MLLSLRHPFEPLEQEIAVFERRQHLTFFDGIAGADVRFLDEAVIRRNDGATHQAFDLGIGIDAIGGVRECQKQDDRDKSGHDQLAREMTRPEQPSELQTQALDDLENDPAIVLALLLEHRADDSRHVFEQFDRFRLEFRAGWSFESERTDEMIADQQRHGENLAVVLHAG